MVGKLQFQLQRKFLLDVKHTPFMTVCNTTTFTCTTFISLALRLLVALNHLFPVIASTSELIMHTKKRSATKRREKDDAKSVDTSNRGREKKRRKKEHKKE